MGYCFTVWVKGSPLALETISMHQYMMASGTMQGGVAASAHVPPCMPRVAPFLARPVQQRRGVYTAALTTGTEGGGVPGTLFRTHKCSC